MVRIIPNSIAKIAYDSSTLKLEMGLTLKSSLSFFSLSETITPNAPKVLVIEIIVVKPDINQ